jgi:hypothetical protein
MSGGPNNNNNEQQLGEEMANATLVGATATATSGAPLPANIAQSNRLVLNWLQVRQNDEGTNGLLGHSFSHFWLYPPPNLDRTQLVANYYNIKDWINFNDFSIKLKDRLSAIQ